MKILAVHPKENTAIHRLLRDEEKYNPHHQYRLVSVHPKRPDSSQLEAFKQGYEWADIIDFGYWKSAEMLREAGFWKPGDKPTILTHYNPYDLLARDWKDYTVNVVCNKTQQQVLKDTEYIPLGIDFDLFPWNPDYTETKNVVMVANRIEGSKGIEPVAQACAELGYRLLLVGAISDQNSFMEIMRHGSVDFYQEISDQELLGVYRRSAIHVCNSKDNFESGTLPILEAMAVGVPVLTRRIGHVPELANDKNMLVRDGAMDDVPEIKALLQTLMEDRERRIEMREDAWHTVRNFNAERRARMYSNLYYETVYKNPLVSVVIPVFGRADEFQSRIDAINAQSYPAIEIVVVSDGDEEYDSLQIATNRTLKYLRVGERDKYGLAEARNRGVVEAEGKIIVFHDQRFIADPEMVTEMVKELREKTWVFANKNNKRNFVENMSCIYRQEFIDMGMFNQLIDGYGGMSQEVRERSRRQGFKHIFAERAIATATHSSHNYSSKKTDIYRMKELLYKLGLV